MKILLTNRVCYVGGIETFMISLSQALRARGHQCELFFFERGPMEQYIPADCVAHFGGLADCLKLAGARNFDVVHATRDDWDVGISAVRNLGAKLIITNHGGKSLVWTSATCDALTGVSKWIAEEQQPLTDLPVQVVMNGIATNRFKPGNVSGTNPAPIVAWVGRGIAVEHKRIDKFAAMAPLLHRAGLRIWLAEPYGPARVGEVLPDATRALQQVAEFWGSVPIARMPDFYRKVAASGGCLVSTSVWEAFGLVLAEAMACGCMVIGPDVGGVNEVVNPAHGGLLYPFETGSVELADLIVKALRDKELMRRQREAGVWYARERFDLNRMAEEYLRVYEAAPSPQLTSMAGIRARLRLSPLFHWADYLGHCWTPGHHQFETSQELVEQQEWKLAAAAARASLTTCPTLFVSPKRLAHLLKTQVRLSQRKYEPAV